MRIILIILTFCFSTAIMSQGFYLNDKLIYNPRLIAINKVKSATASCSDSDSSFHPLSTFVFEYEFDEWGKVVSNTYWTSDLNDKNSRFLTITLIKDSAFYEANLNKWGFKAVRKSNALQFDQQRNRTRQFINNVYNNITKSFLPVSAKTLFMSDDKNIVIDTTILDRKLQLPLFLLPFKDSLVISQDGIISFIIIDDKIFGKAKHYLNDKNELIIDWYSIEDNHVWRSYKFDVSGRLIEENQNVYKTIYSYAPNGLLIKVEDLNNGYSTKTISIRYK